MSLVHSIYDRYVREHLPRKIIVRNGVATRTGRLLDFTDVVPDYEGVYVSHVREVVEPGDSVVVVGGGHGVSAVAAARQAMPTGEVTVYEADEEWCRVVEETIDLNVATDHVTLREAIVGEAVSLRGENPVERVVAPADLPDHDVLALDCEGAEEYIIGETDSETIVVETHGVFGTPPEAVREWLRDAGYEIEREDEDWPEDGINVITAHR